MLDLGRTGTLSWEGTGTLRRTGTEGLEPNQTNYTPKKRGDKMLQVDWLSWWDI
jgi:hypothetical protein